MRRRLALVAILVSALAATAPAGKASSPTPQLQQHARWLVDPQGRVVLLHGVNAVWKRPPYAPPSTAAGFTARDADFLVAAGFNAVRLGVLFAGVMPRPGVIDNRYLANVDRVVQLLASRRIWIQLDFHQDMYNERFSGEGFPDWAVHDDGIPLGYDFGFPGNYFTPAVSRAFDNLYANRNGVADRYRDAWRAVARRWRHQPYLMGYDLINEPWPGTSVATCANPAGCPLFDLTLQRFQELARSGIRAVDRSNIVWFEPNVIFNNGPVSHLGTLQPLTGPQLGLSWHNYCLSAGTFQGQGGQGGPDCPLQEGLVFQRAEEQIARIGATTLLSEFGASDDLPDLGTVTALADQHLVSWMYWHYKNWGDPTTSSQGTGAQGLFRSDGDLRTLKAAKAAILVRPYPQAVAGVPTSVRYDPATRDFHFRYAPRPGRGSTEVFVPKQAYPDGYRLQLEGARTTSAPGATRLLLHAQPGAREVRVSIKGRAPRGEAPPAPAPSPAMAGPTWPEREVSP